ncbi:hypothetical protein B0H13DRAFT_2482844 [Mycena leptocephala]|nr:hypothetical protein B0H13DRAFT_2482844 [Mycena leptocephala]
MQSISALNLDGRGVRVIVVGDRAKGDAELYDSQNVKYEEWWSKKFTPGLVKASDGTMYLDTPFSRLLGKPPIMVAGMTPSTVKGGFVSAVQPSTGYTTCARPPTRTTSLIAKQAEPRQRPHPPCIAVNVNTGYTTSARPSAPDTPPSLLPLRRRRHLDARDGLEHKLRQCV